MNIGAGLFPVGLSLFSVLETQQQPRRHEPIELSEKHYEFRVVGDEPASHSFYFTNWTKETLRVTNIEVSEPIAFVFASPKVLPGKVGRVDFCLAEPRITGDYEGKIELRFKNRSVSNIVYAVTGKFVPTIEISPLPAFFVAAQKGEAKSARLEIFNRGREPMKLLDVKNPSERFDLKLSTMVEGEYYILDLEMKTNAAPGRFTDVITIATSSQKRPALKITANTLVRERVYTFPENVDFGRIDLKGVGAKEQIPRLFSQMMMIYQAGGTNFVVSAESNIPSLKLSMECGETGDRCQLRIEVDPQKFGGGPVNGSILLKTNDREIPELEIPVRAMIADSSESARAD